MSRRWNRSRNPASSSASSRIDTAATSAPASSSPNGARPSLGGIVSVGVVVVYLGACRPIRQTQHGPRDGRALEAFVLDPASGFFVPMLPLRLVVTQVIDVDHQGEGDEPDP